MAKIDAILNQRLAVKDKKPKMTALAQQSAEGNLTSFTGIFGKIPLNAKEKEEIAALLLKYSLQESGNEELFSKDLEALINVTSEVKAINNQAAILHGERIKKAQEIFKNYKEGAFSSWLLTTYGNRQTPYNFLQYFEFFSTMPKNLHPQIEAMPRQAIYTLASRQGASEKKEEIVRNYQGETKEQLLALIRQMFPLPEEDGRKEKVIEGTMNHLQKIYTSLQKKPVKITKTQKNKLLELMSEIRNFINECEII